jgi:hypothetical protein
MALPVTLKSLARRELEMRLVEAVPCLDCDVPRHVFCFDRRGRQRMTCCQARFDFGQPILLEDLRRRALLASYGIIT